MNLLGMQNAPASTAKLVLEVYNGNSIISTQEQYVSQAGETAWEELSIGMTLPANTTSVVAYMKYEGGTDVYFDDLKIEITDKPVAMVVQENQYYPFGLGMKGLDYVQNVNQENKFTFSGKEKETKLSLQMYEFGARNYDPQILRFTSVDRFAEKYYNFSSYQYAANNPIKYIDVNGDSLAFFENGKFVGMFDNGKEEITGYNQVTKTDKKGNKTFIAGQAFSFNDIGLDREMLNDKNLKLFFVSSQKIESYMEKSGVNEAKNGSFFSRISYIKNQSREETGGRMDYYNHYLRDEGYDRKLVIANGVAYNAQDFGNFLWGQGAKKLGFDLFTTATGAHWNDFWNGKADNIMNPKVDRTWAESGGVHWGGDSPADQRAIRAGHNYPAIGEDNSRLYKFLDSRRKSGMIYR
jgi:RHS repeat-associated protein